MNRNLKIPSIDELRNSFGECELTDAELRLVQTGYSLGAKGQSKVGFDAGWIEGYWNGLAFPDKVPYDMRTRNWKRFLSGESPVYKSAT